MNGNKVFIVIVVILLVVGGYYVFFANKQSQDTQSVSEQVEEVSKAEAATKEFIDKYRATTDWSEGLAYTLQAQERLVTAGPVLFSGYVDDIFIHNGKTIVRFSSSFLSNPDFVLELECGASIVEKILEHTPDSNSYPRWLFFDRYIVVADIKEVSKPAFALEGSVLSEEGVEINVEPARFFVAKGTCVDIAYIGE